MFDSIMGVIRTQQQEFKSPYVVKIRQGIQVVWVYIYILSIKMIICA